VGNAHWSGSTAETAAPTGGVVKSVAGRIYFEMPGNTRRTRWTGYVCSGTIVDDGGTTDRSLVLTAAHCVYDDANKAFARNVLFIPDQDSTTGSGTDLNCGNDPVGCWTPAFGVVDLDWTTRTFPDNVRWDYAVYVVSNADAHEGAGSTSTLDQIGSLAAQTGAAPVSDGTARTHALGYSYSDDPNFMYCAENMSTNGADNWWLGSCGLSGGSSGGPWVQPMNTSTGAGPVISVNSWGYTNSPGMAGPRLYGSSASCVIELGKSRNFSSVPTANGEAGVTEDSCVF
jgi:hypothetical protein